MENTVSFQEYLLSKGYLFDPKIIENYLLSIKVKPFVIFTGIQELVKQNFLNCLQNIFLIPLKILETIVL